MLILLRHCQLMLDQIPAFIDRKVEYFKLSGRERPIEMIRDLVRFYRRVFDGVIDGSQTDMSVYHAEIEVLRKRWSKAKSRRVGTLMARAKSYGDGDGDHPSTKPTDQPAPQPIRPVDTAAAVQTNG